MLLFIVLPMTVTHPIPALLLEYSFVTRTTELASNGYDV